MKLHRQIAITAALILSSLSVSSCWIYSFSGTSIKPDVKTICIEPVKNNALKTNPTLANNLTEAMMDKYKKMTSLSQVTEEADCYVYATIESYDVKPSAVTADEVAAQNRLTVTVKVKYTNEKHPEENLEQSFAAYQDYNSERSLDEVENTLCEDIIETLVEDIFNATMAQW